MSARGPGHVIVNFEDPLVRNVLGSNTDGRHALELLARAKAAERPRMRRHLERAAARRAESVLRMHGLIR